MEYNTISSCNASVALWIITITVVVVSDTHIPRNIVHRDLAQNMERSTEQKIESRKQPHPQVCMSLNQQLLSPLHTAPDGLREESVRVGTTQCSMMQWPLKSNLHLSRSRTWLSFSTLGCSPNWALCGDRALLLSTGHTQINL